MRPDDMIRLTRIFTPGQRVRAALAIVYGVTGLEIDEGDHGTVADVQRPRSMPSVTGLVHVVWDRLPTLAQATSADGIDLLLRYRIESLDADGVWGPFPRTPTDYASSEDAHAAIGEFVSCGVDRTFLRAAAIESGGT